MQVKNIIQILDELAPGYYQESYDNTGLLIGNGNVLCTGVLCTLDATEAVVEEAIAKGCNLIVAHHPIIFGGLKKITGKNYVERTVINALRNDIAIYAIHTNLDNIINGVNKMMADKLQLINRRVLLHKQNTLMKLAVFVPVKDADMVRDAMFTAGAGNIGNYSECSYSVAGYGTFKPGDTTNPHIGKKGIRERVEEVRIEVIFPVIIKSRIVESMLAAHPYEEVAYDLYPLANQYNDVGSGLIGELTAETDENEFLHLLKNQFNLQVIKHTQLLNKKIKKVALCGGAGSFMIKNALSAGADFYITGDIKYHEFFDAENKMVIADIGHFESEQFTVDLLYDILHTKFPTFAILKSEVRTNPVHYFT